MQAQTPNKAWQRSSALQTSAPRGEGLNHLRDTCLLSCPELKYHLLLGWMVSIWFLGMESSSISNMPQNARSVAMERWMPQDRQPQCSSPTSPHHCGHCDSLDPSTLLLRRAGVGQVWLIWGLLLLYRFLTSFGLALSSLQLRVTGGEDRHGIGKVV